MKSPERLICTRRYFLLSTFLHIHNEHTLFLRLKKYFILRNYLRRGISDESFPAEMPWVNLSSGHGA